jgi:hypothetical protein
MLDAENRVPLSDWREQKRGLGGWPGDKGELCLVGTKLLVIDRTGQ